MRGDPMMVIGMDSFFDFRYLTDAGDRLDEYLTDFSARSFLFFEILLILS